MNKAPKMGAPATMLNDDIVSIRPTLKSLHERHARAAGRALDVLFTEKACCCTCCCARTEQVSDLSDVDLYHLGGLDLTWAERDAAGRDLVGVWSA